MSWFGDIFNDIGRALNTVIPNEVKPIIKAIATPVAVAVTGVTSIPAIIVVSTLANIATGQKPEDAIKNAAISTVTSNAGSNIIGGSVSNVTTSVLGDTAKNVIVGGTTVGDVVTGSITKAATGAATAALTGGDVAKSTIAGAVSGGVAPVISGAMNVALGTGDPKNNVIGPQQPTGFQGGLTGGITPLISNTIGGIATGKTPEDAFKSSIPGAVGGALSGAARYGLGLDATTSDIIGKGGSMLTQYATTQPPSAPSYTPPVQPGLSLQGPQSATVAGPSATLGQSLSIAPTLGYTPTGSVFGSSDTEGKKSNVWNVGSLRNIGAAEA